MNISYKSAYFIKNIIVNIKSNFMTFILTAITISISLFLFGLFWLLFLNIDRIIEEDRSPKTLNAFLNSNITEDIAYKITNEIRKDQKVNKATYISSDRAKEQFTKDDPNLLKITKGLTINPFPASIEVMFARPLMDKELSNFVNKLNKYNIFKDIIYEGAWLNKYLSFIYAIKYIGWILIFFLLVGSVFIISNTIKLALYKRKDEIEIYYLVGATKNFIRGPILVEAILQGVTGSFIAIVFLSIAYWIVSHRLNELSFMDLVNVKFSFLPFSYILFILIFGVFLGFIGTFFSVDKFLRISR